MLSIRSEPRSNSVTEGEIQICERFLFQWCNYAWHFLTAEITTTCGYFANIFVGQKPVKRLTPAASYRLESQPVCPGRLETEARRTSKEEFLMVVVGTGVVSSG